MKSSYLLIISVVALIIAVVGVTLLSPEKEQVKPLKLGHITYPGTMPFFVAKEKGFFEKYGVNVELVEMNDFNQWVSALAGGDIQLFYSTADLTPVLVDAGVPIKEVFALDVGYGSDGILVKNDTNSLVDLKNKTVYLPLGGAGHFMLRYITSEAGLDYEDIELVHMEGDQVGTTFVAGKIDYGMTWEPWLSKGLEREDGKLLWTTRDKQLLQQTLVVREDTLQQRREDVKAVMKAILDAIEYWENNREEANAIAARNMGLTPEEFELQVETVKFLNYNEVLKKFDKSEKLNIYDLKDAAVEIFKKDGIIQGVINVEDIIDDSLVKELYE